MKLSSTVPINVQRVLAVLLLLAMWQVVIWSGSMPSMTPGVLDVGSAVLSTLIAPVFWAALGKTLLAALAGWAIASVVGVVLGLFIGSIRYLDRSTSILIDFGRSFPVLALMPVVIMLLGSSTRMEIVVVGLSCLWPVLVQTIYGARRQEAAVIDTVKVFRIPRSLWFRRVLLPGALPFVATGVRISAAIAILVAVGVEVISQAPGIGRNITLAQQAQNWDVAFAYLFFAGLVGWAIAWMLQSVEARLLKWNRQDHD
ncbi:ABC transporter permease [Arthrobacter crystallopoietes]|uniref:ABC transporter permease n=1 Tax=Crystallibacter crystallopoietes TaxID=37928 RepID=UPI0011112D31|nr:ABC transporter permease subunit [Arthrobacter crystallopoietes]QTG81302.1 ABC transporter permease subunit [Arthrobacter crystallopoietes]